MRSKLRLVIHKRELALSLLLNRWAPFTVIIRLALRLLPYTRFCIFYSHNRRIFATAEGKPSFSLQRERLNQTAVRYQPFLRNWGSRIEILGWVMGHVLLSLDIMNGNWRPLLPLKWHFRFDLSCRLSLRPWLSRCARGTPDRGRRIGSGVPWADRDNHGWRMSLALVRRHP